MTLLAAMVALQADYRTRFPLPGLRIPDGLGVNVHFTDPEPGEIDMIADAGYRWVRMDFVWSLIETRKGVYDFRAYDRLMTALAPRGIRPIFILDYGNDLYQDGSPRTAASRAAFCGFVRAAVERFRGRGVIWEMWNEPNIRFWRPIPNANEYIALAKDVARTIRSAAPDEWLIGPATSGFDWAFLERCFKAGLLTDWDGVSVHPYRNVEPETVIDDWAKLRALIDDYRPRNHDVAMICGEWGYSELYPGLTREKQAAFAPRQYLANLASGVGLSIWYDWRDDGPDPKEPEHHFGVVTRDLKPKTAYLNVQQLTKTLAGFAYAGSSPDSPVFRHDLEARLVGFNNDAILIDGGSIEGGIYTVGDCLNTFHPHLLPLPRAFDVGGKVSLTAWLRSWAPNARFVIRDPHTRLVIDSDSLRRRLELLSGGLDVEVEFTKPPLDPQILRLVNHRASRVVIRENAGVARFELESRTQLKLSENEVKLTTNGGAKSTRIAVADSEGHAIIEFDARLRQFAPTSKTRAPDLDGDRKVRASVSARFMQFNGKPAQVIDYDFSPGWKFMNVRPNDARPLEGKPNAFGVWVFGDGSGHMLRMRYTDATDQTFQPDFGPVDWKGWRWVAFRMDGSGGRWGGANDGKVHYPIRIESVVVFDSAGGRGGKGRIAVGPGLIIETNPPQ